MMDTQRHPMAISDIYVWVCSNAAGELLVQRSQPSAHEGVLPHPVLAVPRGEILSAMDADSVTREMLYDTVVSLAGLSDPLRDAIGSAVMDVDDLDVHNVADWRCWTCSEPEDARTFPCQAHDLPVVPVRWSEVHLICPFQPRRFLATDLDDQYVRMAENEHTLSLLSSRGVTIATGVNAYDPFSSPALSKRGVAEELYGEGYEQGRLLIVVHGFHPAYTPDPLTRGQQTAIPVAQMQSLLMYCLQASFPNAVIILTHKHAKVRRKVGGPPLTLLAYEAEALFGRIWNRVESSREEMYGENMCMVSNFDVLPPEVVGPGGLDLYKAVRSCMMEEWPVVQFASNHCELTASLVFQTSTIIRDGQHHWDAPHWRESHHGYRRAVGDDFAGTVRHRPVISRESCALARSRYARIVEEATLDDGSLDFNALAPRVEALLGEGLFSRSAGAT